MALVQFATAPDGDIYYVKSDAVQSLSPPFPWSDVLQARTVILTSGERISVLDIDDNVRTARTAIDLTGGALIVTRAATIPATDEE